MTRRLTVVLLAGALAGAVSAGPAQAASRRASAVTRSSAAREQTIRVLARLLSHGATLAGTPTAREPSVLPPSRSRGATLAGIVAATAASSAPGGRRIWWVSTQTTWSGEPQVLLVLRSAWRSGREWLKVLLPIRPDGAAGWIPRDNVVLMSTHFWVTVSKPDRRVRVYRRGTLVRSFLAVIGKPATPTPDGLAAIYEIDRQADPNGFEGTWALPLTALSNVLNNFGGGPGRVAIHGRAGASLSDPLGSARSHGCIRVANRAVDWLARSVPQGTPVQIIG